MQRAPLQSPSQRRRPRRVARLAALATVVALGVAACGSDDDETDDTILPSDTNVPTGPLPTTAGSGPLDTFEVDTTGDTSDGTVLGDPMEPATNDTTAVSQP